MLGIYPYQLLISKFHGVRIKRVLRYLQDSGDKSKLEKVKMEQKQPSFFIDKKTGLRRQTKLINIFHKDTEEVHRVPVTLFNELKEKGFVSTSKSKLRWFENQINALKLSGGWEAYKAQMILQY